MTHFGHFRLFKQVKDKFPNSIIVVGVSGDEETIRLKGNIVMNEKERTESIQFCRYVDEVICPCPWIITQSFIDEQNIDYVAHDGLPYVSDNKEDIYNFVKEQGRFIATQRTEGISTTGLINRIICRYNEYVLRNLKRGITRKELNVSWTRMKRIELKHEMHIITENVEKWTKNPDIYLAKFLNNFARDLKKFGKEIEADLTKIGKEIKEIKQEHPEAFWLMSTPALILAFAVVVGAVFFYWKTQIE